MAGITDLAFRLICKEHGADVVYSEMVSAAGLVYNKSSKAKTLALVKSFRDDFPLFVQLFGSKPNDFARATRVLEQLPNKNDSSKLTPKSSAQELIEAQVSRPEGIDLNFGCPVKKVLKQAAGCALMKKPALAYDIIQAVCDNTTLPVSIKIRAGVENHSALEFLEKVAPLRWQTVIIHGRTFRQGFSGPIDSAMIKKIKTLFPEKTVIANGGIVDGPSARKALTETGADGLAIGRGCLGRPWLFSEIKAHLNGKLRSSSPGKEKFSKDPKRKESHQPCQPKTLTQIKAIALDHLEKAEQIFGPDGIFEFRKHLGWYFQDFPGAKSLRTKLFAAESFEAVKKIMTTEIK